MRSRQKRFATRDIIVTPETIQTAMVQFMYRLTNKEVEIIKAVTTGKPHKQTASEHGIAEKTVNAHMQNIYGKLRTIHSIAALTHFAIRSGFVKLMEFKEL